MLIYSIYLCLLGHSLNLLQTTAKVSKSVSKIYSEADKKVKYSYNYR